MVTRNRSAAGNSLLGSSHILDETSSHLVESHGVTLPVIVTEILTLSESKKMFAPFSF